MKVNVLEDYDQMSKEVASCIVEYVNKKPHSVLCLAGGQTPLGVFKYLIEAAKNKEVNFSECKFVSLDEWVGLGRETKGSCIDTLYTQLYDQLQIKDEQICFFDGLSTNIQDECKKVDDFILNNEGIDIILLGIGMNGHIGFNEPNVDPNLKCTVVPLDSITKEVCIKYFETKVEVSFGITLGMQHIMESNAVILIANGEKKANIVKLTVEGEKTIEVPSSLLQNNTNAHIYLDEAAASQLERRDS